MTLSIRTALLFADGNFIGPEYFAALVAAGIHPNLVIAVGLMSPRSTAIEKSRTGGLWNPTAIPPTRISARFKSLEDTGLWQLLTDQRIDIAIQGGIGILTADMITAPKIGFLNVHPGRLPQYRGRNCPEWALLNGDPIWTTAHMIDTGIDTGPIVHEREYAFEPNWSYEQIRASLYRNCAGTLVEALAKIDTARKSGLPLPSRSQSITGAHSWPKMEDDTLTGLRARLGSRIAT